MSLLALLVLLQVEIIAHRGASAEAPENTNAAFVLGWAQGEAVELDVRLTRDGRLAAVHDATTKRTTGVDKAVAEQTLAELKAQDAGRWKGERWAGERIPTLEEALERMPAGKRLYVEIKCGPEAVPELVRVLEAHADRRTRVAVIGFGYAVVVEAKRRMPDVPVFWLAAPRKDGGGDRRSELDGLIAKAREGKLDGLDLSKDFPIDRAFSDRVREAGLKLLVWTVNDEATARRLAAAGVDGITTDRPQALRAALK